MTSEDTATYADYTWGQLVRMVLGPLQAALAAPLVLLLGYLLMFALTAGPFVVAPAHHHQAPPTADSCYGALTNYGC